MIASIVNFINGNIYKVEQTNKTIHLSDGKQYNNHLFHQNMNIVRSFIFHTADSDDSVKAVRAEIASRVESLKQRALTKMTTLTDPIEIAKGSNIVMKFGKYKGLTLSRIAIDDPQYIMWLVNLPTFDAEATLNKNKIVVEFDHNLKTKKQIDWNLPKITNTPIINDDPPF